MPLDPAVAAALTAAALPFEEDAPLRNRTWWRAGGPADATVRVTTLDQLVAVQRIGVDPGCPVFVMGNASNLLVSDRGIRGLVVRLEGELASVRAAPDAGPVVLEAGAGARLVSLVGRMQREGWTGLEAFAGIPGTIGGAVRMNAGTTLGETGDRLVDVTVVLPGGDVRELSASEVRFGYRHSELPAGAVVASARFQTTGDDPEASRAAIARHLDHRARTQPIDVPTCGSTFRNPPGDTAGRLIDAAGLKGHRIGGAQVSEKHANFLVNTGSATAGELRALIAHVQRVVAEVSGVTLHPEVHLAGDWPD